MAASCDAGRIVGVPPPKNTVEAGRSGRPARVRPASSISAIACEA
jgi:hypothetical protein